MHVQLLYMHAMSLAMHVVYILHKKVFNDSSFKGNSGGKTVQRPGSTQRPINGSTAATLGAAARARLFIINKEARVRLSTVHVAQSEI
jgi:hypothetical protein